MSGWVGQVITNTELDLKSGGLGYRNQKTQSLLALFDENVKTSREAIVNASDADYGVGWSLKMGPQVLMTAPRSTVVRQHMSHLSHHRGQMTVYLRLLDIPVPSIYGPTADEGW